MRNRDYSLTIRMGATEWSATLANGQRFDFRKMTTDQRKQWYGIFMSSVRKLFRRNRKGAR